MQYKSKVFPEKQILETKTALFNNVKLSAQNNTSGVPAFKLSNSTPASINTTRPHKDGVS